MKKIILSIALTLAIVFSFSACQKAVEADPSSNAAASTFAFSVVDKDGNKEDFNVAYTDGQSVCDALLAKELIAGEDSEYGLYVKTVNGITYDYNTDGYYWAFYIDGEYATTSVENTKVESGKAYSMVGEKG